MKLKLKVSKALKRNLKVLAQAKNMERPDFVKVLLLKAVEDHTGEWQERFDGYQDFLLKREEDLKALRASLEEDLQMSPEEKSVVLKKFYADHHIYRDIPNKNKKFENIIVHLEEDDYYKLQILAENNQQTIEAYSVKVLNAAQ